MGENRDGEGKAGRGSRGSGFVLTIREGAERGRRHALEGQSLTIGRAPGNDLTIQHTGIGRYHAVMVWEGNCWLVQDLSSPTGTFVNGQRITKRHPVRDGDVISLGGAVSLQLSAADAKAGAADAATHAVQAPDAGGPIAPGPSAGEAGPAPRERSKGWMPVAVAILLGVTLLLALVVVVVLVKPSPEGVVSTATPASSSPTTEAVSETAVAAAEAGIATPAATTAPVSADKPAPAVVPAVSATPCIDNAAFVEDVTLLDGSIVSGGELIDKTWRIRNTGTCMWRDGYRLEQVEGDELGMVASVLVADTAPGTTTDVAVPMFAPKTAGDYRGVWQMMNPQGEPFGEPVEVSIVVPPAATPAPESTAEGAVAAESTEPELPIHFWADRETIQAGEATTLHILVSDVAAVWLDGDVIIGGRAVEVVTPCHTTDYVLDVELKNGSHVYRTVTVNVTGQCPTPARPDLSIVGEVVPAQLAVGESAVVSYTVLNRGDAVANGFDVVFTASVTATQPLTVAAGLALDAGYGLRSAFTYTWPVSGEFEAVLSVDASGDLDESDEDNNMSPGMAVHVD